MTQVEDSEIGQSGQMVIGAQCIVQSVPSQVQHTQTFRQSSHLSVEFGDLIVC